MKFERDGMMWDTDKAKLLETFSTGPRTSSYIDMASTKTTTTIEKTHKVYKTKNGRFFMVSVESHNDITSEDVFFFRPISCGITDTRMRTFDNEDHMNQIVEAMGFRMSNTPLPEA